MSWSIFNRLRDACIRWLSKDIEDIRELPLSNFERIQYELRPCDVLLIEGRSRISRSIKLITQSSWSHAALYIGRLYDIDNHELREKVKEHYTGNPDEQLVIESVLGRGIIVEPLTKYKHEHIRICRPQGISRQDAQQVIGYTIERLGRQYDVRQIFDLFRLLLPWTILPRRWRSSLFTYNAGASMKESCSSLIAEAFQSVDFPILPVLSHDKASGIELVQRHPRLFTPSDFDYSPFFEIIKYPILELSTSALYRNLPWNRDGTFSDKDGRLYVPKADKKPAVEAALVDEPKKEATSSLDFFD
jgi:hypothetical protein